MKPGIYARYSSDLQREASIDDQQRRCAAEISRHGWPTPRLFADSEIAGSVARARPGYQALLAAARSGEINVIVVDELSRLTRDPEELAGLRKRLKFWGCHLMALLDGVDTLTAPQAAAAVMLLGAYRNETEIEAIAHRTRRGLEGRVRAGMHAGGAIYGYRTRAVHADRPGDPEGTGEVIGYEYIIHEAEAQIIRQIFEWYSEGLSGRQIAHRLNEQGIPSPGARWRDKRPLRGTWCHTAIQGSAARGLGILNNEKYIGRLIWNRTHRLRDPERDGKKALRLARENEWTVVDAPELRIVPQELWDAVKARQHDRSHVGSGMARVGRTMRLLSGLLHCSNCGARLTLRGASVYRCAAHFDRGNAVCATTCSVNAKQAERGVLNFLGELLSSETGVKGIIASLNSKPRAPRRPSNRDEIARQIAETEKEATRLVEALGKGVLVSQIEGKMRQVEARLCSLKSEQKAAEAMEQEISDTPVLPATVQAMMQTLHTAVADGDTDIARRMVRLAVDRIEVRPQAKEGRAMPGVMLAVALQGDMSAAIGLPTLTTGNAQEANWTVVRLPGARPNRIEVGLLIRQEAGGNLS